MNALTSPILLRGDDVTAYRDPAAVLLSGVCYLYFTYVDNRPGGPWLYLAERRTRDFVYWSDLRLLTPKNKALNYSSPGSIVRDGADWVICFQTYCRENGEKYGNANSRLYTMRSRDLERWSEPELLRVKRDSVPFESMGRMIDPFLLRADGQWWCFFKQNGVSYATSPDLRHWTFVGHTDEGENSCVVPFGNGWRMFSSPENGLRVMDSDDLVHWRTAMPNLTLGQREWPWAAGRVTAGFVTENTQFPDLPRYLLFFHASRAPESLEFDSNASIGLAYSDDLNEWSWPGKAP